MDLSKANWRKSSRSSGGGNQCVEVAAIPGHIAIRDSKKPDGPAHVVPARCFEHLITRIKHGDLSF